MFLNQSVLADFDDRKKKICTLRLVAFQARVIIITTVIIIFIITIMMKIIIINTGRISLKNNR